MQEDLGLTSIALGLAFSAFNYTYAPFQLVGAGSRTGSAFLILRHAKIDDLVFYRLVFLA
jgi:hypothetical protein